MSLVGRRGGGLPSGPRLGPGSGQVRAAARLRRLVGRMRARLVRLLRSERAAAPTARPGVAEQPTGRLQLVAGAAAAATSGRGLSSVPGTAGRAGGGAMGGGEPSRLGGLVGRGARAGRARAGGARAGERAGLVGLNIRLAGPNKVGHARAHRARMFRALRATAESCQSSANVGARRAPDKCKSGPLVHGAQLATSGRV